MMKQWIILGTCCVLVGCLSSKSAHAEGATDFGTDAHGVNRVIRTPLGYGANGNNGYLAVGGTATIDFTMPTDKNGDYSKEVNPYNNKPSAYVGGQFRAAKDLKILKDGVLIPSPAESSLIEADLGIQFEPNTFRQAMGWTAFGSVQGGFVNPQVWNTEFARSEPWRGGSWAPGSGSITTTAQIQAVPAGQTGAGAKITVSGLGTFYWNQDLNYRFATPAAPVAPYKANPIFQASQPRANVKRVTAMTRANGSNAELDGSWMQARWSNCWVINQGHGWPASDVNQNSTDKGPSATGYDAPGDPTSPNSVNQTAWDSRVNGKRTAGVSRTIVQFREDESANRNMRSGPADLTRYANETVTINLKTVTEMIGKPIETP